MGDESALLAEFFFLKTYAKNPIAPVGSKAAIIRGKTTVNTPAQNRFTATARLIPASIPCQKVISSGEDETYHDGTEEMLRRSR